MFRTSEIARVQDSSFGPDQHYWQYVQQPLLVPWLYVDLLIDTPEFERREMLLIPHINIFIDLKDRLPRIMAVYAVVPHQNGESKQWTMGRLTKLEVFIDEKAQPIKYIMMFENGPPAHHETPLFSPMTAYSVVTLYSSP